MDGGTIWVRVRVNRDHSKGVKGVKGGKGGKGGGSGKEA